MLNWKPEGKKAAVCFTIDDIHPAKSSDFYEAGGDLDEGHLGQVKWLLERHPKLKVTLFTTADWRQTSPFPQRKLLASIPWLRDKMYLAKPWRKGTMSLENHPEFVRYLNNMARAEVGYHGLYHIAKGPRIPVEFQDQSEEEFAVLLKEMKRIFDVSGINHVNGICPPGWNAPDPLLKQLVEQKVNFVASARDLFTKISRYSVNKMSGIKGVPLLHPMLIEDDKLIHYPTNFQANSPIERAKRIIDNGGLLSIKAHIIDQIDDYTAIDGVNDLYMNYLDVLFGRLKREYGDDIWWTSMGEMTNYIKENNENYAIHHQPAQLQV